MRMNISGMIIDPVARRIFPGHIQVTDGIITAVREDAAVEEGCFILPPLIDSHIHIESSMLTPGEFARCAVCHGTGAVVADPHEIANVLGVPGIDFMIADGKTVPLAFYFGAPSCVPATPFESAGAVIDGRDIAALMARDDIYFLGEMMNFPGVIHNDPEVMAKIRHAHAQNKPIDGHGPKLHGTDLNTYINAGISTDHEATTLQEAMEKINRGMQILIREGSSARDFDALHTLISSHPQAGMFCSDDLHPDDLLGGHINRLVKKGLAAGHDILDILQYSCVNPVRHYGLDTGLLQQGDRGDFIVIDNLDDFTIKCHYAGGVKIAEGTTPLFTVSSPEPVNNFHALPLSAADLHVPARQGDMRVIQVKDGELVTTSKIQPPIIADDCCIASPQHDLLKICVINRYRPAPVAIGFVSGFGLKTGAMASSIAHDSHNVIGIGCSDRELMNAVNEVIKCAGGIAVATEDGVQSLPLPIAGLMGRGSCTEMAVQHQQLEDQVKKQGCRLTAPFMTMSFLALPVIPHLKITDQGLFDVDTFSFTPLFQECGENGS
jgi:adenine deaminase